MPFVKQMIRKMKRSIQDLWAGFWRLFKRNKYNQLRKHEPTVVPRSWKKPGQPARKKDDVQIIEQQKFRLPGLRTMKRILAGILLLINFTFSQFLLGSIGNQNQAVFIFFLANSFIIGDYLWKTRGKKKSEQ